MVLVLLVSCEVGDFLFRRLDDCEDACDSLELSGDVEDWAERGFIGSCFPTIAVTELSFRGAPSIPGESVGHIGEPN